MKTRFTTLFLTVFVLAQPFDATSQTPVSTGVPATAAQPATQASEWSTNPVLLRLNSFYAGTTDFSASFKQVVETKSPKRSFRRGGNAYFKRPGMMRWDYSEPGVVNYVSSGGILWVYDSEDGSALKMNVADSELYSALGFLSGTSALAESFSAQVEPSGTPGFSSVKLLPLTAGASFRHLVLLVKDSTGEVVETEVLDPAGNVSRIRFESPRYVPIPASAFQFSVPAGVKVQDLTGDRAGKGQAR